MPRRTGGGNRICLAIIGLVLLLAGATALVRGLNLRPGLLGAADVPILDRATRAFAGGTTWFWGALAAALILIALLALLWLAAQIRTGAVRTIRLESDPRQGSTAVPARALTGALQDDLTADPYLRRASVTLAGAPAHPRLSLSVTLEPDADVAAAKDRIHQALDRIRQAMQAPGLPAVVHIRTGR